MIFEPTIKKLCYNYLNLFQVKMETRSRKRKLNPLPPLPKEEPKAKVLKEITEQCKACNQEKVLLRHLGKSPKCRDQYPDFEEMKKNAIKSRNKTCCSEHLLAQRMDTFRTYHPVCYVSFDCCLILGFKHH